MENSFFEYRDKSGVGSDSETEVIDNSLVLDVSFTPRKKLGLKNLTVAESEESSADDETEEDESLLKQIPKPVLRSSSVVEPQIISSSEDDASRRGSIRRQSENSSKKLVLSSSDEDEASPEILPKRRPLMRPKTNESADNSVIGRRRNKRMILMDSDTENSIVIENNRHNKIKCLKDTPLKIDDGKKDEIRKATNNIMDQSYNGEESSDSGDESEAQSDDSKVQSDDSKVQSDDSKAQNEDSDVNSEDGDISDEDDGPDEDQMVMSRATRMSIMGVVPQGGDSDDSDFIQSDEKSRASSANSFVDYALPDTGITTHQTPPKTTDICSDTSRLTCSPIASPLHDITNEFNDSPSLNAKKNDLKKKVLSNIESQKERVDDDVTFIEPSVKNVTNKENERVIDDDVTIIDTKPEIIALSSDDEDEVKTTKKSPKVKEESTSRRSKGKETMKQYLVPPSYPNQVVYVKKKVREQELSKLEGLKEDLHNVKYLLENMDVDTLPDGGVKLIERLTGLEQQVRLQGDKVASMLVEPDEPTPEDMAKDGFGKADKGLSWDDIQKASNAVQPRMFGKQAMATHMAERNLILERLRDLHESLASRPSESAHAEPPRALRSTLMPHQLHALAWLRWRETQRPCGGILADDMGLGKTITMISLIVADKESAIDNDNDDDDDYTGKSSSKLARGGTLVVCPASLMQQWAGEVGKHCAPHALSYCLHHGAARAQMPQRLATHDLVMTTYNIMQRDHEKNGVLMRILWRRVILDEAHIVRNHKSATSGGVCALRGRRRWCLTGTPVQNKDLDLFALLKFLRCTPFDELTMWKKWIDNKSLGGQERLSTIMRCILLRRTKQQLQQKGQLNCLPERTAHQKEVVLDKDEMNVYQKVLVFSKTLFAQFLHQRAEKQADAGGVLTPRKDSAYAQMHKKMIALQGAVPVKSHEILVLLLRLRQVCCHCGLIAAMLDEESAGSVDEDPGGQDLLAELNKLSLEDSRAKRKSGKQEEKEEEEPYQEGTTAAEAIRSVLSPNNPVFQLSRQSSKIRAVMQCLRENVFSTSNDKAVVVSQWTSVLRLVEQELEKERIKCVTLSGNVPVPARPPLIQSLNDPASKVRVMLLSLCAGGVGLNLCGANHLLLLDPHWNPQLEEQAQDRIYRVGQTKPVHIYRFMCVDTVEQTIRKLQQAKLELAENVLTGARNTNASKLTIEDLKMLFNMGQ